MNRLAAHLLAVAAATAIVSVCPAQTLDSLDRPPQIARLSNGVQIVVVERRGLGLVSVQLWWAAGAADDPADLPGATALVAGLIAERGDASGRLAQFGFAPRFEHHWDAVGLIADGPASRLTQALAVQAERLRPAPLPANVDLASTAPRIAARLDPPTDDEIVLLDAAFAGHPYRRPPGTIAARAWSRDALEAVRAAVFQPSNATLLIVGDVSAQVALEQAKGLLSELPWKDTPRRAYPTPPVAETITLNLRGDAAALHLMWVTPPEGFVENTAIEVLLAGLCATPDGPLTVQMAGLGLPPPTWRILRGRDANAAWLSVAIGSTDVDIGALGDRVLKTVRAAADTAPTPLLLNRARTTAQLRARLERMGFAAMALALGRAEMIGGDVLLAETTLPRLGQVSASGYEVAAARLRDARTIVLRVHGEDGDATLSTVKQRAAALLPQVSPRREPLPSPESAPSENLPAVRLLTAPPEVVRRTLSGGVGVVACSVPDLETATLRLEIEGDPSLRLTRDGVRLSKAQRADYLSYHGMTLTSDDAALQLTAPRAKLAQGCEVLADAIHDTCGRLRLAIVASMPAEQQIAAAETFFGELRRSGAGVSSQPASRPAQLEDPARTLRRLSDPPTLARMLLSADGNPWAAFAPPATP